MKIFRSVAVVLIFVLASSPALAAICATACASQSAMSSLHANSVSVSGKQHCHDDSINTDKNKTNTEHKSCAMGATCHFTQVISQVDSLSNYVVADLSSTAFPKFVPFEKSIDLSPPLKPPA